MQIKGNCFIPPTNLFWLPATGLWGEIQPWRKPESKSLVPSALCRKDLLLLRDAPFPGLVSCLEKCWGVRLAEESGMELCPWAQGWALRRAQEEGTECPRTRSCILVMAKEGGTQGRAGSCSCTEWAAWVGASPQTVNSSKANKRNMSFEGQKEFVASSQMQQVFLARRGRALNHHF